MRPLGSPSLFLSLLSARARARCHKFSVLYANFKQNAQSGRARHSPERRTRRRARPTARTFRLDSLIATYSALTVSPRPLNSPARHHELYLHPDGCHRLLSRVLSRAPSCLVLLLLLLFLFLRSGTFMRTNCRQRMKRERAFSQTDD